MCWWWIWCYFDLSQVPKQMNNGIRFLDSTKFLQVTPLLDQSLSSFHSSASFSSSLIIFSWSSPNLHFHHQIKWISAPIIFKYKDWFQKSEKNTSYLKLNWKQNIYYSAIKLFKMIWLWNIRSKIPWKSG